MTTLTKDPNEGLLKALQCPCCSEYMVPPISFCENGHNICKSCKPKHNRCPDCKQPFLRGRNLTLENVSRQVEYPCAYRNIGCPNSFPVHQILEHQTDCPFSPYNCPVILTGRRRCPWKGPLTDMKDHLSHSHEEYIWDNDDDNMKTQTMVTPTGLHNNVIIRFGNIFYLQFRGENGNFYGFVKYIGPKHKAECYRSEISISSKDDSEMIMARYAPFGYKEDNEEIIKSGKCLKLHYDVVKKFLDHENNLFVKAVIVQLNPEEVLQE